MIILYKGGRRASWHGLSQKEQDDSSQAHVDLMLTVAEQHGLQRIEGFKLLGPQEDWERFWIMAFPTLAGVEAWMEAEMAPTYGLYGYYEYFLARSESNPLTDANQPSQPSHPAKADPRRIPALSVDHSSLIVILFERLLPGLKVLEDIEHIAHMRSLAREHHMMRLESFALLSPQDAWHRVWIAEFPTLGGAEAWMASETRPERRRTHQQTIHLARKWAPSYFAQWVNPIDMVSHPG
jgi:hypothetical protein